MIVKITTDSLTFVNTARIKEGLNRLEKYGRFNVHPSEPRTRFPEDNVNVIFNFEVVTYVDPSATQILRQIIAAHRNQGTQVYFVGLTEDVKRIFTRAKIWALLGDGEITATTVEDCMELLNRDVGIVAEAQRRASEGGRDLARQMKRYNWVRSDGGGRLGREVEAETAE